MADNTIIPKWAWVQTDLDRVEALGRCFEVPLWLCVLLNRTEADVTQYHESDASRRGGGAVASTEFWFVGEIHASA